MKNNNFKYFILISCLILVGCSVIDDLLLDLKDEDDKYLYDDSPSQTNPPSIYNPSTPSNPSVGDNTFLWKPVSENNGRLVVLIPASLSYEPVGSVTVNGESGNYTGNHNGNRAHFRFSKPGSSYGNNVRVILNKAGQIHQWTVPNGSERYTQKY